MPTSTVHNGCGRKGCRGHSVKGHECPVHRCDNPSCPGHSQKTHKCAVYRCGKKGCQGHRSTAHRCPVHRCKKGCPGHSKRTHSCPVSRCPAEGCPGHSVAGHRCPAPSQDAIDRADEDRPPLRHEKGASSPAGCPADCPGPHVFAVSIEADPAGVFETPHRLTARVEPPAEGTFEWFVVDGKGTFQEGDGPAIELVARARANPPEREGVHVRVEFRYREEEPTQAETTISFDAVANCEPFPQILALGTVPYPGNEVQQIELGPGNCAHASDFSLGVDAEGRVQVETVKTWAPGWAVWFVSLGGLGALSASDGGDITDLLEQHGLIPSSERRTFKDGWRAVVLTRENVGGDQITGQYHDGERWVPLPPTFTRKRMKRVPGYRDAYFSESVVKSGGSYVFPKEYLKKKTLGNYRWPPPNGQDSNAAHFRDADLPPLDVTGPFCERVRAIWSGKARFRRRDCDSGCCDWPVVCALTLTQATREPYKADIVVANGFFRSSVRILTPADTKAVPHEFGHWLGCYDEYRGARFEHPTYTGKDPANVMGMDGTLVRKRQFEFVARTLEYHVRDVAPGATFEIAMNP